MRRLPLITLAVFMLLLAVPFANATQTAAHSGVNTSFELQFGNDFQEGFVNIPYTVEDVGYPDTLFYAIFFTGVALTILGFWLTSRSDHIPSYTLIGVGVSVAGLFAVCAFMAPLVCTYNVYTQIIPTVAANGATPVNSTNTIYQIESLTYIFSPWVTWAMEGGIAIGLLLAGVGILTLYRGNKEKSVEPSVNQDGDSAYKDAGRKYRGDTE